MYILYYKEAYIVPEPLTKNRTHQTWRGKQIAMCVAMCETEQPLINYMDDLVRNGYGKIDNFYIEKQPEHKEV